MPKLDIKRSSLSLDELLQTPDYAALIHPSILAAVRSPSPSFRWIAVEAQLDGQLAGLALAEIYPLNKIAKLESLVIKESFSGQGIWRALFSFMQELLVQEEKMRGMEWTYDQDSPSARAMEKILASLGWAPPVPYLIRLHFDAYAFNPPWIHRSPPLPYNMQFFPWSKLSPQDRGVIENLGRQGRFLPYLSPLHNEEKVDFETSVGLRKDGVLVGWSVTQRPDPATILYYSLYIDNSLSTGGYGIRLLVESIRRHKKLPIPQALFEIKLKEIDPAWWNFVNKRLLPLAAKIERIKSAFRVFQENLSEETT